MKTNNRGGKNTPKNKKKNARKSSRSGANVQGANKHVIAANASFCLDAAYF